MNWRKVPLGLAVFLAVLAVHARSLGGGFHYDDEAVVLLNGRHLRDPSTALRAWWDPTVFSGIGTANGMYRPVTHGSQVLDAALWGWEGEGDPPPPPPPFGWHLTNLLLHAGAALALYHLLIRVLRARAPAPRGAPPPREGDPVPDGAAVAALLGALWFGLQPVNAEVVNYVSARSESLAALFFLLALLAHHAAWEEGVPGRRRGWLVLASCAAAALSFGSKETGALLPAVAGGLELFARPGEGPLRGRLRAAALRALPLAGVLLLFLLARTATMGAAVLDLSSRPEATGAAEDPLLGGGRRWGTHLPTQARVVAACALLVLFPVDLAPDHGVRAAAALDGPTLLALLGLAGSGALAVRAALRGSRAVPLAALWAGAALAPSVLVPLNVLMNEHRLYLPTTGLALGAGVALAGVLRAGWRLGPAGGAAAGAGVIALFSCFAAVDVDRARAWGDAQVLWGEAVATSPASWRNHLHLGVEAYREGERRTREFDGRGDRGSLAALTVGKEAEMLLDHALEEFRAAHDLYPGAFEVRLNLGFLHLFRARLANREADPDLAPPRPEEFLEAARWFALAEEASPGSFRALYNRATALAEAGRWEEAAREFERLSADTSRTTMYAYPLVHLYRRLGRTEEALGQLRRIEGIEPGDAGNVALLRGEVLARAGRFREAEEALRSAASLLGKEDPRPPLFMARMLAATGLPENLPALRVLWRAALDRGHRPGPKDRAVLDAVK